MLILLYTITVYLFFRRACDGCLTEYQIELNWIDLCCYVCADSVELPCTRSAWRYFGVHVTEFHRTME